MTERHAWVDASAGIAGDMLLGALLDAGAELTTVQQAVAAVIPGAVQITAEPVTRAGLAATRAQVDLLEPDPAHRSWRTIRGLLADAALPGPVQANAHRVFERLAQAEARVHRISPDEVHFHEVGALDSIADVVGVCAAVHALGIETVSGGELAVGSGSVQAGHGTLPVPVPAVVALSEGWRIRAGGDGELATPTGVALITTLATTCRDLPAMRLERSGAGAGRHDRAGRANVTRVLIGALDPSAPDSSDASVVLEANVDDLDPRLWPGVLARLLRAGASDAWLIPILMKKGRPAHTLCVLSSPQLEPTLREVMLSETSTIGVRSTRVSKFALPRVWGQVAVEDDVVLVKVAHREGIVVQVTPEFDSAAAVATRQGRPQRAVVEAALAAASDQGLTPGAALPPALAPAEHPSRQA